MPTPTPTRLPKYRHYKPKDLAVVRIDGRDVYLGRYDSPESHEKYRRVLAEWLAGAPPASPQAAGKAAVAITVNELILGYIGFADGYYVKNDKPTAEPTHIRLAARPLRRLYGLTPVGDFGPLALKAVRQAMIDGRFARPDSRERALCRTEINRRIGRLVRMFKWGVENELVPPSILQALKAVNGLRRGRTEARESGPVTPVPEAFVDAIKPHVPPQVAAMIDLQMLTGMRPGEAVAMRTSDIDTSGRVWVYRPRSHKSEHRNKHREVYLGPRAQVVLRPWLRTDLAAFLFQPREVMEQKWADQRAARKTPVQPSQRDRSKPTPRKTPGDHYTVNSYRQRVQKACLKGGVPSWHPHQLRHNAATRFRREHGIEATRILLGHSSAFTTEIYAEVDREKALRAMAEAG